MLQTRSRARYCRNCEVLTDDPRRGLCRACYVWAWRYPDGPRRPWPRPGRMAKVGPCPLCGSALPHTAAEYRLHRKIYLQVWLRRRAQTAG